VLNRLSMAPIVAVDVETTGTAWTDTLRTVQLGSTREALVLRADLPEHMNALRNWFGYTTMPLTAHNATFDIRFLVNAGVVRRPLVAQPVIVRRPPHQILVAEPLQVRGCDRDPRRGFQRGGR
jgi:hypothetical protein